MDDAVSDIHLENESSDQTPDRALIIRDEKYYMEGADCVILVENVLFKVHRFLLSRDSSAFQNMFSMPRSEGVEGSSEENPIVLGGESAESFRALMWVLYALPPELEVCNSKEADIDRMVQIAEITNKYHFGSLETWATEAVHKVLSGVYGTPLHPLTTSDRLARVLEMSVICGHPRLRDAVVSQWTSRILCRELEPAPALLVADKYDIRTLRGVAYYIQLFNVGTTFSDVNGLNREQWIRLMSGHWSLVNLWDRLRISPPKFEKGASGCVYHQNGCISVWATTWLEVGKSEKTLMFGSADVIGKLRCMEEQLSWNPDLSTQLTPQCRTAALASLQDLLKEVEGQLADHFIDHFECKGVVV